jgi:hypothetical protein
MWRPLCWMRGDAKVTKLKIGYPTMIHPLSGLT